MNRPDLLGRADAEIDRLPDKTLRLLVGHFRREGVYEKSERAIDELERRHGQSGSTLDLRADLAETRGESALALSVREHRARQFPDETGWIRLARSLLELDSASSQARLRDVELELDRFPTSDLAIEMARSEIALGRGRIEDARVRAEALLVARPHSSRPGLLLALIALEQGQCDLAEHYSDKVRQSFGMRSAQQDVRALHKRASELECRSVADIALAMQVDPGEPSHSALENALIALYEAPTESEIELDAALPDVPDPVEPEADDVLQQTLRDVWGYDELRPGQATVIQRAIDGLDTLAIMPTGAGKSITFQLPALLLDGPVVVISPLIALMHDQLTSLPEPLKSQATYINSTLKPHEMDLRLDRMRRGEIRLLYAAPERFRQASFLAVLRSANVRLVVIDEAHCVSMWGHDFRPDYFFLARALEELGDPPTLAVTATATPTMAQQIGLSLGRSFQIVRTSAFRENLHYSVERLRVAEEKAERVVELCAQTDGSTIVYVSSRKNADLLADKLRSGGIGAVAYHAGMTHPERTAAQDGFLCNRVQVIVATIAFGMGINKPNVRMIVHHAPSRSLEAYIQESGRAGRDGLPARCVLLYTPGDTGTLRRFAHEEPVSIDALRRIYAGIKRTAAGRWCLIDRIELASLGSEQDDVNIAVGLLEQANLIRRHPDAGRSITIRWSQRSAESDRVTPSDKFGQWLNSISHGSAIITVPTATACEQLDSPPSVLERAVQTHPGVASSWQYPAVCLELLVSEGGGKVNMQAFLDRLLAAQAERAEQMIGYLTIASCRHAWLARHLGETIQPCGGTCDRCKGTVTFRRPASGTAVKRLENPYFAALAQWRTNVAREMVVPAFVIASDRLLDRIATERPMTREALRGLSGIGDIKDREFGEQIIAIVQSVSQRNQSAAAQ